MERIIKMYEDIKNPYSLGGIEKFAKGNKLDVNLVRKALRSSLAYGVFKPRRVKFERRKVIVRKLWYMAFADLLEIPKYAQKDNDNCKFILVFVEGLSRRVYLEALKTKTAGEVLAGFKKILDRYPKNKLEFLGSDGGSEFKGVVKKYFASIKVKQYVLSDHSKASLVERKNLDIRKLISRLCVAQNSQRFIDKLRLVENNLNSTINRNTGFPANKVTEANQMEVFSNLYNDQPPKGKVKFKIDQAVRISRAMGTFEKISDSFNYTMEIFYIHQILTTKPVTYKIRDHENNVIEGAFYDKELQLVNDDVAYRIDKVLGRKKIGGKTYLRVTFQGYDSRPQLILAENVEHLK